jgi:hypothetical protein
MVGEEIDEAWVVPLVTVEEEDAEQDTLEVPKDGNHHPTQVILHILLFCYYCICSGPDPGSGAFIPYSLDHGSGMNFFRISDPGSGPFFGEFSYITVRVPVLLKPQEAKKVPVGFIVHPSFFVESDSGDPDQQRCLYCLFSIFGAKALYPCSSDDETLK